MEDYRNNVIEWHDYLHRTVNLAEAYSRQIPGKYSEDSCRVYEKTLLYNRGFFYHLVYDVADPLWLPIFKEKFISTAIAQGKSRRQALREWEAAERIYQFLRSHAKKRD